MWGYHLASSQALPRTADKDALASFVRKDWNPAEAVRRKWCVCGEERTALENVLEGVHSGWEFAIIEEERYTQKREIRCRKRVCWSGVSNDERSTTA